MIINSLVKFCDLYCVYCPNAQYMLGRRSSNQESILLHS